MAVCGEGIREPLSRIPLLKGFRNDRPLLIGNEQLAKQVWCGGTDKPALGFKRMSDELDEAVGRAIENQEAIRERQAKKAV